VADKHQWKRGRRTQKGWPCPLGEPTTPQNAHDLHHPKVRPVGSHMALQQKTVQAGTVKSCIYVVIYPHLGADSEIVSIDLGIIQDRHRFIQSTEHLEAKNKFAEATK
jgi:hypothetical protein